MDNVLFLNDELSSSGQMVQGERTFHDHAKLGAVPFLTSYFEAIPTPWAAAWMFEQSLNPDNLIEVPSATEDEKKNEENLRGRGFEELLCMALLHYLGRLQLDRQDIDLGGAAFDPELLPAISGTYPYEVKEGLRLRLLKTGGGHDTVVGAYYKRTLFFPARDRSEWRSDGALKPYLTDAPDKMTGDYRLSWEKCARELADRPAREKFLKHLLGAPFESPRDYLFKRICKFAVDQGWVESENAPAAKPEKRYTPSELDAWIQTTQIQEVSEDVGKILQWYPLQTADPDDPARKVYFVFDGLEADLQGVREVSYKGSIGLLDFSRSDDGRLKVKLGGSAAVEPVKGRVVRLRDLLLDAVQWCSLDHRPDTVDPLHQKINDAAFSGLFPGVKPGRWAVCLAPLKLPLFKYFPSLLDKPGNCLDVVPERDPRDIGESKLRWELNLGQILGLKAPVIVRWRTPCKKITLDNNLSECSLSIWPPSNSENWHLYAAKGDRLDEDSGWLGWCLLAEDGCTRGDFSTLGKGSYLNVLCNPRGPARPRAMSLLSLEEARGPNGKGGWNGAGMLFLPDRAPKKQPSNFNDSACLADLSTDLGTSNSCLAFSSGDRPQPLRFSAGLAPAHVWGPRGEEGDALLDLPGFVPLKWATLDRGFFQTIMLVSDEAQARADKPILAEMDPTAPFQVDIASLHKDLADVAADKELEGWDINKGNIKWGIQDSRPSEDPYRPRWWRGIFLSQVLLYAHAELFFGQGKVVRNYAFTYPLAINPRERNDYLRDCHTILSRIRQWVYGGENGDRFRVFGRDESSAVSFGLEQRGGKYSIEVFMDIGGGTTDMAVQHDSSFCVLDSVRIAGEKFFRYTAENWAPEGRLGDSEFKDVIKFFLLGSEAAKTKEHPLDPEGLKSRGLTLQRYYTLKVNRMGALEYNERMRDLVARMPLNSYEAFRTKLFYNHILSYGLVQAMAAVLDPAVGSKLPGDRALEVHLILTGNAWGMFPYGQQMPNRDEVKKIADKLFPAIQMVYSKGLSADQKVLLERLQLKDVVILSDPTQETNAKTVVAVGALKALNQSSETFYTFNPTAERGSEDNWVIEKAPFAGLDVNVRMGQNKGDAGKELKVRWFNRWNKAALEAIVGSSKDALDEVGESADKSPEALTSLKVEGIDEPDFEAGPELFVGLSGIRPSKMAGWSWNAYLNGLVSGRYQDESGRPINSPAHHFLKLLYPDGPEEGRLVQELAKMKGMFSK